MQASSGAVLAQAHDIVADILIAGNLVVVSPVSAAAEGEDPVAQYYFTPVRTALHSSL